MEILALTCVMAIGGLFLWSKLDMQEKKLNTFEYSTWSKTNDIRLTNLEIKCKLNDVEVMVDELKNNVDIVNQKNESLYTLLEFLYTLLGVFGICLCPILLFLVFKYIRK